MTVSAARPVSPRQHRWLVQQADQWRSEGLIDDVQLDSILGRYTPSRRFELIQLVLGLGATFVGVALIWLVATNFDRISPAVRFAGISAVWLLVLAAGEWQATRHPGVVAQVVRGLAAICFGAVIFQAAQSFQVPAFAPHLLGLWAFGAFAHAYLTRAPGPFTVGLAVSLLWLQYQILSDLGGPFDLVQPLALAAVFAVGLAGAHRGLAGFATGWREVAMLLGLLALFIASLPVNDQPGLRLDGWRLALLVAVLLAVLAGAARGDRLGRLELGGTVCVAALAVGLSLWPSTTDIASVDTGDWLRTACCIVGFLLTAAALAADGVLRESWRLTVIAFGGLVLFTMVQAFAVIGPIISGAWLFLVVGVLLLLVGTLGERGRRELRRRLPGRLA